jgi:homoserine kinase
MGVTMAGPLTVRVPATSANLGPGFDVLGLALQVYNTVTVAAHAGGQKQPAPGDRGAGDMREGDGPAVTVEGEGAGELATDASNLVYRSIGAVFARAGRPLPALLLHLHNRIPVGRGLGSSAAAIAGGVVAANALLGDAYTREELLECALALEPHPDNLAAALYGGVAIAVCRDGALPIVRRFAPAPGLKVMLLVPDGVSSTAHARGILPLEVSRADAVFNMSRTALLVHALAVGDVDILVTAMEDRLHQPQRGALFPALPAMIEAARAAGAYGAALSGAGSTVLAFAGEERAPAVGEALLAVAARYALGARVVATEVALDGASLEEKTDDRYTAVTSCE